MAFLDELGKKISDASQGVVQKTKDTAQILKLSSALSDEEKKINSLFAALGKEYFNAHAETCEEEPFKDIISQITDAKNTAADLEDQIKRLKGFIKCPYCSNQIVYGATFCSFCGKNVENYVPENKETALFCTNCGTALQDDDRFCTSCGTKVGKE